MKKKFLLNNDKIELLTDIKGSCIASDKITVDGKKIGYMYKEEATNEYDSGWRFFEGSEDEEYTNNADNFEIYELNTICNYDRDIIPYLNSRVGIKLERNNDKFIEVE